MLNEQDLKNILAFLNRVQLQGSEAVIFVQLQQKIAAALEPVSSKKEKTKEDDKS